MLPLAIQILNQNIVTYDLQIVIDMPVSVVEVHPVVSSGINKLVAGCSLFMKDWMKDIMNNCSYF